MKFTFAIILLLFVSLFGTGRAAGPIRIVKVSVECSGQDITGTLVCSALKEKVRRSSGFQLVQHEEAKRAPTGFCVHLVSVDITTEGGSNLGSAIAIVFTLPTSHGEIFIDASIERFGKERVEAAADAIFADLDKDTEFLQK